MEKPKTIMFDLGGVIVPLDMPEAVRRFAAIGVDTDKWLDPYGQKGIFLELENGSIGKDEFLAKLSEMVGREVTHQEAAHAWVGFVKPTTEERIRMVQDLRLRGHRVVIASNTNPYMMEYMHGPDFFQDKPIDDWFDHIYASCDMKAYKPDAKFFTTILEAEGIRPEEAVFVDDSRRNVTGAEALGIYGIWAPQGLDAAVRDEIVALQA